MAELTLVSPLRSWYCEPKSLPLLVAGCCSRHIELADAITTYILTCRRSKEKSCEQIGRKEKLQRPRGRRKPLGPRTHCGKSWELSRLSVLLLPPPEVFVTHLSLCVPHTDCIVFYRLRVRRDLPPESTRPHQSPDQAGRRAQGEGLQSFGSSPVCYVRPGGQEGCGGDGCCLGPHPPGGRIVH